jgi:uncharacterized protein YndB with AHSA1/START domain
MNTSINIDIIIDVEPIKVWHALTKAEYVIKYFYDSILDTNWESGSTINFYNQQEGEPLKIVHGIVLKVKKNKILKHTLFPSLAEYDDVIENHLIIKYSLHDLVGKTELKIEQTGFDTVEQGQTRYQESLIGWNQILPLLKETAEKIGDIY